MQTVDKVYVEILAQVQPFVKGMMDIKAALDLAMGAVKQVIKVVGDMYNEYAKAQKGVIQLTNAFAIQGQASQRTITALTNLATRLQSVTEYGDDAIVSAMKMTKQLTTLDEQGIKALIPHILDFASAMDMDLQSAAMAVAKTIGSDTNALSRYGIEVKASASESEKLADVITQLTAKFSGMAVSAGTSAAGQVSKLNNAISDLKESMGGIIAIPATPIISALSTFAKIISGYIETMRTGELSTSLKILLPIIDDNAEALNDYAIAAGKAAGFSSDCGTAVTIMGNQFSKTLPTLADTIAAMKGIASALAALNAEAEAGQKEYEGIVARLLGDDIDLQRYELEQLIKVLERYIKEYDAFANDAGGRALKVARAMLAALAPLTAATGAGMLSNAVPNEGFPSLTPMMNYPYVSAPEIAENNGGSVMLPGGMVDLNVRAQKTAEELEYIKQMGKEWEGIEGMAKRYCGYLEQAGAAMVSGDWTSFAQSIVSEIQGVIVAYALAAAGRAYLEGGFANPMVYFWLGIAGVTAFAGGAINAGIGNIGESRGVSLTKVGPGVDLSSVNNQDIQGFPRMAGGGIVTKPTLALIGERGPEAVVPLGRGMGGRTVVVNITVQGSVWTERDLARAVAAEIGRW